MMKTKNASEGQRKIGAAIKSAVPAIWAKASRIMQMYGLTSPQLRRYAEAGLITTSCVRLPGQRRGARLYRLADVEKLIEGGIQLRPDSLDAGYEMPQEAAGKQEVE